MTRDKAGHFIMIKQLIYREDKTILKVCEQTFKTKEAKTDRIAKQNKPDGNVK